MGDTMNPITTDKSLMGESTDKIIPFEGKKTDYENAKRTLSVLMDFEIDEAISILSAIKKEKDEKKKRIFEYDFWTLVRSAWAREMESDF